MAKIPLTFTAASSQPALFAFSLPVRVYFENTDAGGVVYHGEYLRFFERARTEWLRHMGFTHDLMAKQFDTIFVVNELTLTLHKPARLDDALLVTVTTESVGRVRATFLQTIALESSPEDILARAKVSVASVSTGVFKPKEIPPPVRERMLAGT
jgi:acyl-CoA thioester hydrolase